MSKNLFNTTKTLAVGSIPFLLEYICPGRNDTNRSQSSLKAFISDANQIDPEKAKNS